MQIERWGAWPARLCWIVLAVVAAPTLGEALDGRSTPVVVVAAIGLWLGWGAALVALLVPRDTSLTALRILVPAGLAATVAGTATGETIDAQAVIAVAVAAVATLLALAPGLGEAWVDGSSYGSERRFPLRPPAALSYALVPVTWTLVVLGASVGPMLLAARQWLPGLVATAAGAAAVWAGVRSLHQLARRWVVLVPAGMVLHDPLTLPEPQLFLRRMVGLLGPAPADVTGEDLTAGAPGLALRLELKEPVDLLLRDQGRGTVTRDARIVLFTPSRPRHLLDAARERRLPVG